MASACGGSLALMDAGKRVMTQNYQSLFIYIYLISIKYRSFLN